MEATTQDIPSTQSYMRQVRMDSHGCRPHQASDTGRQLLAWSVPSHVQAVPPAQECQGEGWYDHVNVDVGRLLRRAHVHHLRMTGG